MHMVVHGEEIPFVVPKASYLKLLLRRYTPGGTSCVICQARHGSEGSLTGESYSILERFWRKPKLSRNLR